VAAQSHRSAQSSRGAGPDTRRGESLEPAALTADACLADAAEDLAFLLHVTPVNLEAAWRDFSASDHDILPDFEYRPLAYDLDDMLATVAEAPIEAIEDPVVADLLREKRDELEIKLRMLGRRNSEEFLIDSLRVYGPVEEELAELAKRMLYRLPAVEHVEPLEGRLDAVAFAARAERELDGYREQFPDFAGCVEVSEDALPGLMVSGDTLYVGAGTHVPKRRAEALIQHEVGVHLVTRFNGCCQPLQLLATGLAGYDVLQEGLAVVAEYLVGGLSRSRCRILAARVLAVECLCAGAGFVETFRLLHDRYGFREETAFNVAARVYRSGGLTKDAVYLRGLASLLVHLGGGGGAEIDLDPLLVGKVDLPHLESIRDLLDRELLEPPVLRPRFLELDEARGRLAFLRAGATPLDLLGDPAS
jgi:uncharacterized protein (TIGR02421 family)